MYVERLPPHDEAAEEAVLGSLLIEGESITRVGALLRPDDFYRERNRWCYSACEALFQRGEAINQVTVAHELDNQGHLEDVGGAAFLSSLVATVPTSVHIDHYAHIVKRGATMRGLIRAATDIAALGYEGDTDVESTLTRAEDMLFRIRTGREARDFVSLREVLDRYLEQSAAPQGPLERGTAPIPTGFVDMDRLLGGLHRTDLIILAARPSIGKSTLAMNIARNAAAHGSIVGIFSLEMGMEQWALRLLAAESRVDSHRLRLGIYTEAEERRIIDAVGALSEISIYIDDSPLQNIVEVRSKARRLHLERGLDLLILDYMQLMQGGNRSENRVQEISEISRSLKGLARDLNVPFLAVSQLSRAIEMRPSHRPQLSDLRESGSIEQDADVVAFIYRDDVYHTEESWANMHPGVVFPRNIAEIIVAKHRNGPVGNFSLYFRDTLSRFEGLATQGAV